MTPWPASVSLVYLQQPPPQQHVAGPVQSLQQGQVQTHLSVFVFAAGTEVPANEAMARLSATTEMMCFNICFVSNDSF